MSRGPFVYITEPSMLGHADRLAPLHHGDERYVHLDALRNDNVKRDLMRELKLAKNSPTEEAAHICYVGHRGIGKTTELQMVIGDLKDEFHFVYKQANADLSNRDLDFPDLMLFLAYTALEGMPPDAMPGDDALAPIENWFTKEIISDTTYRETELSIRSQAGAGLAVPGLLKLLAKLHASAKGGHKSVLDIRATIRKNVDMLIQRLNELFSVLRQALRKAGKPDHIVLVLDNLDRLPPEIMKAAFADWAPLFHQLKIHLIITTPLPLIYNPTFSKVTEMGFHKVLLTMPKIRTREQGWDAFWPEGVAKLSEVIRTRVDVAKVFAGSAEEREATIRRIVLASGGSLRDVIRTLAFTGREAFDVPATREHVEKALRKVQNELMDNLRDEDLACLVHVHQKKEVDRTELGGRQLFFCWALEYNGDMWVDVHPLVFESRRFKNALKEQNAQSSTSAGE